MLREWPSVALSASSSSTTSTPQRLHRARGGSSTCRIRGNAPSTTSELRKLGPEISPSLITFSSRGSPSRDATGTRTRIKRLVKELVTGEQEQQQVTQDNSLMVSECIQVTTKTQLVTSKSHQYFDGNQVTRSSGFTCLCFRYRSTAPSDITCFWFTLERS